MRTQLFWLTSLLCPALAQAAPQCAELATNPAYGLAGRADVLQLTAVKLAGTAPRCEVNFIYSSRGGLEYGYDAGEQQRVAIRIGLPLNAGDGGVGGVQGAWNGRTRALGGGGCVGSVGVVTSATTTGYVGSSTDSGHVGGDCLFALQPTSTRLNIGRLNDFVVDSLLAQVRWSKVVAGTYYGVAPALNYWDGCSTGGRQGFALAQRYPEELDGWLVGAPAVNYGRMRIAQLWGPIAMNELAGGAISTAKTNQATASAIAACDADDGVVDGILQEPRSCKFSATANICGTPTAPAANCLTPGEAKAIDLIWDGPRNSYGKHIYPGLTRGAQISALNGAAPSQTATSQLRWNHSDANVDWSVLTLADFAAEAQLGSLTTGDIINTNSVDLDAVRNSGKKILMWQGTADQLITDQNSIDYYTRVAARYGHGTPDFSVLQSWFRYFRAPGVAHCNGGVGPQPQGLFEALVDWVERGNAPETIASSGGGRSRPICAFPQTAIYNGTGNPNLAESWHCGGDVQTKANICTSILTPYRHETEDALQAYGKYNPAACNDHSKVPIAARKAVVAADFSADPKSASAVEATRP